MKSTTNKPYDILIAGAGFAGSLTALVLQKKGLKVGLLEKGKHPRFAIGESSTPVADMILRKISEKYDLPWLYDFSRYGSWQKSHPEIICGLKRGFSFFKHSPEKEFFSNENHKNELLVAASSSNELSDTNWLRSDVDAYFVAKVKASGIDYFDLTEITNLTRNDSKWKIEIACGGNKDILFSTFFIDATGSSALAEKFLGTMSSSNDFLTNSFAVFSHFTEVPHWSDLLAHKNIPITDFPFDPDWSALHQILDEGWMWMLRFRDERTSIGFVIHDETGFFENLSGEQIWNHLRKKYPSVNQILKGVTLHEQPGKIIKTGRLQRKLTKSFGEGWLSLPHSTGFVDPLFSSGIAFSLSGIENLLEIIDQHWNNKKIFYKNLKEYEKKTFVELELADRLISGCYQTMPYFELFITWAMLYFAVTIAHEKRRLKNEPPGYFLNGDDPEIHKIIYDSYDDLLKIVASKKPSEKEIKNFSAILKERIKPFNSAGLMDTSHKNMYRHTAAKL